jgi:hypothetical protein
MIDCHPNDIEGAQTVDIVNAGRNWYFSDLLIPNLDYWDWSFAVFVPLSHLP